MAPASADPLDYALAREGSSVIIAPFAGSEQVAVLTVKKNVRKEPATPPAASAKQQPTRTSHYVSSGFLGLSDEVELEEGPAERKSWWKRLFDS